MFQKVFLKLNNIYLWTIHTHLFFFFLGTFGLPFGMFMSQPVYIINGEWQPNYNFPTPDKIVLIDIISKVKELLIEYDLGKRFYISWNESKSQISE